MNCIRSTIKNISSKKKFLQQIKNYKGQLLELTHAKNLTPPVYEIIAEEGPEHDKVFTAKVDIGEEISAVGEGKNKKNAEQEAARKALKMLKSNKTSRN